MNPFIELLLRSTFITTVTTLTVLLSTTVRTNRFANRWILRTGLVTCCVGVLFSSIALSKPFSIPSTLPLLGFDMPLSFSLESKSDIEEIERTVVEPTQENFELQNLFIAVSLTGMTAGFLGLLRSWLHARRLISRCRRITIPKLQPNRLKKLGIHLLASEEISSPVSCRNQGIGYVIFPKQYLDDLGFSEIRAILRHEFSHLSQRDHEWQFVCHALLSLCWWNPFLYALRHRLSVVHEDIADMEACRRYGKANYSSCLLGIAGLAIRGQTPATALPFNHTHRHLSSRIRMLLTFSGDEMKTANPYILSLVSVLIFALSSTACVTIGADDPTANAHGNLFAGYADQRRRRQPRRFCVLQ